MAEAPKFRKKGRAKEFVTDSGATYLVLKFSDNSVAVLRKVRDDGTKSAATKYIPLAASQRDVLKRLGARSGSTYQMGIDIPLYANMALRCWHFGGGGLLFSRQIDGS